MCQNFEDYYYVSQVSFNLVKTIIKWQVFIFITITFIFNVSFTPNLISSFRHRTIWLFFLFKKYPDISNYIILLLLFFSALSFSVSKSLQIFMMTLSFFLSSFSSFSFIIKKSANIYDHIDIYDIYDYVRSFFVSSFSFFLQNQKVSKYLQLFYFLIYL